jgi:hypothetical protein
VIDERYANLAPVVVVNGANESRNPVLPRQSRPRPNLPLEAGRNLDGNATWKARALTWH